LNLSRESNDGRQKRSHERIKTMISVEEILGTRIVLPQKRSVRMKKEVDGGEEEDEIFTGRTEGS